MGLYLYCLCEVGHPPPDSVSGLGGAAVRSQVVRGFSAWVSDLERTPAASLDHIRVHNAVVEAAAREVTPLPLRFGQWFETPADLEASLQEKAPGFQGALARVSGALEYGVRVLDPTHVPEEIDRASGTAYLEALARRSRGAEKGRQRGRQVAAELKEWLGGTVRDERVRSLGAGSLVSIAHLVDRHDTGSYRQRMDQFPARHPDLHFVVSGPWPPYGFVT